jgi:hypothetical protein
MQNRLLSATQRLRRWRAVANCAGQLFQRAINPLHLTLLQMHFVLEPQTPPWLASQCALARLAKPRAY